MPVGAGTVNRPSGPVVTRALPTVTVASPTGWFESASSTIPEIAACPADSAGCGFRVPGGAAAAVPAVVAWVCAEYGWRGRDHDDAERRIAPPRAYEVIYA